MSDTVSTNARQFAAGALTPSAEALRLLGVVANPMRFYRQVNGQPLPSDAIDDNDRLGQLMRGQFAQVLQGAGEAANNAISRRLGVNPEPSVLDNTGEAISRFAGGSAWTLPIRGASALMQSLPMAGRVAARAAELLTPITVTNAPTVAGRMAARVANTGVQTAAAGGLEYLLEDHDPTVPRTIYDMNGQVLSQVMPMEEPGAGRILARGIERTVGDHPYLTGGSAAAALGLGLLARRAGRRAGEQLAETASSDVTRPVDRSVTDVPIIDQSTTVGRINNAAHRAAEVLHDANIRTKDAVRQSDPDPEAGKAARDAIDMVQEPAHKDRLISMLEDGIIVTPRGTRNTESLRRIAEDLYHQSIDNPELSKLTKELLVLETELDNRAYAVSKGLRDSVLIDVNTGKPPVPGTPPGQMAYITPRATLHNISDQDLVRRIRDIGHNNPQAAQLATRYWKLHSDLADAWVDFGLVSKQERAMWGRANPHFMHTINLDNPKSPRTYRAREHNSGPEFGGDPILSAVEYADYMMAHVYRNRMRRDVVNSLRAGAAANPGAFGNGKWIGKVAHPAEIRRRQVIDPRTGQLRAMTKEDVNIQGDSIHYYDDGELVNVEIRNPQLMHTLNTMPTAATSVMGVFRQIAQSGMTGKLATLVGQPFTIANATMGGMYGAITRPAGKAFGYLDQALQRATQGVVGKTMIPGTNVKFKNPIGLRGDPTIPLSMLNAGVRDTAAILTRTLADAFHNSIAADGLLSKVPGAQAIADRAARKYVESMYSRQHQIGAGSASTLGERERGAAGGKASVIDVVTPHGNMARVVSDPKDWKEALGDRIRQVTPADLKIAGRMFSDIHDAVGNMAQSALFRQNYGKVNKSDQTAVIAEARYSGAMARAEPHLDNARMLEDRAKTLMQSARGNNNKQYVAQARQQAHQLRQQARIEQSIASQYEQQAQPYKVAADRAREAWYREYMSLGVATRQLLGDPAMQGSGLRNMGSRDATWPERFIGRFIDAVPYGNIGWQATARLIRAAKENPGGTAAAIGMTVFPMAILPIWNAVRLDREREAQGLPRIYVNYELSRPGWDGSRYILGAMNGLDPDQSPRMRIDPLLSLPYTLFREGAIELFGLNKSPDDPARGFSEEQLDRIVRERMYSHIRTAAINAQPFSQLPSALGAGAALVGQELGSVNDLLGRGESTPIIQRGMGGPEGTRLNNDTTSTRVDAVIGQLAGGAGMTVVGAIRSGWQSEQRDPGSFGGAAFDEVKGRAQDRLPEFQPLWDQPARRATNNSAADLVNAKEHAVRSIIEQRPSITGEGTIGSGRFRTADPEGGGMAGIRDPAMRRVMAVVARFDPSLQSYRDARTRVRREMLSIEQRGLPYADRRLALNRQSREIDRLNTEMLARYVRFEDQLSQRTGFRIRLDRMDMTKPLSQFPPLNR